MDTRSEPLVFQLDLMISIRCFQAPKAPSAKRHSDREGGTRNMLF